MARRLLALAALLAAAALLAGGGGPPTAAPTNGDGGRPGIAAPPSRDRGDLHRPPRGRATQTAEPPGGREGARPRRAPIRWRSSQSLGTPTAGRLVRGVRLPAEGRHFATWDPVRKQTPNRPWRRHGHDRVVRTVLRVLRRYAARHPGAPRVLVGDLSRPRGGDFGRRYGPLGHVSHQNGLDVDVYYPRRDRRERAPRRVGQVDRRLAQDLVGAFVRAGASRVLVGPSVALTGPPAIVQPWPNHDDHLHARFGS